jgi:hypothetical protein
VEASCIKPVAKASPSLLCILLNDSRKITYLHAKLPSFMPMPQLGNKGKLENPWNIQLDTECSDFCHGTA